MAAKPRNATEVQLETAQRDVTRGQLADAKRKRLLMKLWEAGMTQGELAERLSRAAVAAGGKPISENAVYKLISHLKKDWTVEEAAS